MIKWEYCSHCGESKPKGSECYSCDADMPPNSSIVVAGIIVTICFIAIGISMAILL